MANESTISMFKRMDAQMDESLQFLVPVNRGGTETGPSSYRHTKEPPIWEKSEYTKLLTGASVQPTVSITQEDVDAIKEKSYRATEMDFNNYVGALLKPNENPANKAFLMKIYPGWFAKQKQAVENWHEMKKKIETLKLMGPRNEEDLFTLYRLGYSNGEIGQNADQMQQFQPLVDQLNGPAPGLGAGYPTDTPTIYANFQRGIFNTDRRQLASQAIMGNQGSIWPSGSDVAVNGTVSVNTQKAVQDKIVNPITGKYPYPVFR